MSSILFPLRTNIKSLQRWGPNYDISARIKQSMILYDEVILETGTYLYSKSDRFVLHDFDQWNEENTKGNVLKRMEEIEKKQGESYITVIDGKTGAEKSKYKVEKQDRFVADYRTVDVLSEIESESYGKEGEFLKYAYVLRKKKHRDSINLINKKDLENRKFAETARRIYGDIPLVGLLSNLNDSLALSHLFKMPITVDVLHAPLLKIKAKSKIGLEFSILDRLAEMRIPDFSTLNLDNLLELRKDKAINSFRELIGKINSQLQSESTYGIDQLFMKELLEEIKEVVPTRRNIALEASLGTLSLIPVPLIGIATTIFDVGKELKEYKDFATNWLSFVLKARELDVGSS